MHIIYVCIVKAKNNSDTIWTNFIYIVFFEFLNDMVQAGGFNDARCNFFCFANNKQFT